MYKSQTGLFQAGMAHQKFQCEHTDKCSMKYYSQKPKSLNVVYKNKSNGSSKPNVDSCPHCYCWFGVTRSKRHCQRRMASIKGTIPPAAEQCSRSHEIVFAARYRWLSLVSHTLGNSIKNANHLKYWLLMGECVRERFSPLAAVRCYPEWR